MPFCTFRLQHVKRKGCTALAGASYSKFHYYNRKTKDQEKCQIDQYKGSSTVSSYNVRKSPHIAQTNGTACWDQDEAKSGRKFFTFHWKYKPPSTLIYAVFIFFQRIHFNTLVRQFAPKAQERVFPHSTCEKTLSKIYHKFFYKSILWYQTTMHNLLHNLLHQLK